MTIEIFLDIETLPTSRHDIQARCVADVAPPGNYKKPESIAEWWAKEGDAKKAEAIARTALNGTWGEVIAIGFAVDSGPVSVLVRDADESSLLAKFGGELSAACERSIASGDMWPTIAKWIGHNIMDFDLRFLWQRSKLLGTQLPFSLPIGRQFDGRVFDTMKEWAGYRDHISQSDLELAFGILRVDPLVNGGADVFTAYQEGRVADIAEHCRVDIENLRAVYRRMTA
jgi:hypothetical protein